MVFALETYISVQHYHKVVFPFRTEAELRNSVKVTATELFFSNASVYIEIDTFWRPEKWSSSQN